MREYAERIVVHVVNGEEINRQVCFDLDHANEVLAECRRTHDDECVLFPDA